MDVRSASGHEQSWESTLFSQAARGADVDHTSTVSDKLALFRTLFGGRTDVDAHRWENPSTATSGWSPTVRGGWSSGNKRSKEYLPLNDDVFESHLRGEATIGIYPLLRGDTCTLLACDFDGDGWPLDAVHTDVAPESVATGLVPAEGRFDASIVARWTSDTTLITPTPPVAKNGRRNPADRPRAAMAGSLAR